ncbi:DUF4224 domain-containing protein [Endozoicomonas sp.]|uniref:DUF4224 domain-containing protein n=1 Tax=Endozoicomonas sp. TaxID=1892382 RepID=UPI003AF91388
MDDALLLDESELRDITGYQKPTCQLRALQQMGFRAAQNARGRVLVSRRHAEQVLSGSRSEERGVVAPNFDWMEG